jgi:hypothetical protein
MHHSSSSSVVPEILDLLMRRYDIRKINQILCGAFFTSITSIRCTLSTLATTKGFENDFLTLLALRQCHTFIRIIINATRSGARCIHTIAVEKFLIVHPNVAVSIESVETRIRIPSRLRKGASVCKYVLLLD